MENTNTPETGAEEVQEVVAEGTPEEIAAAALAATEAEKPAEPPPGEAPDEKFAAKFAALSRKEKQLRHREAQVANQLQEMEARLKAFEAEKGDVEKYKAMPERLKKDTLKVLEEQGIKLEDLAQLILNDGKPTPDMVQNEYEKKMTARIEEFERKMAEKEKKEQEERVNTAVESFKAQLTDFVNTTADYELIRAHDYVGEVFDVIDLHHEKTGEILSNKEACDIVEEYLLEEAKKLVDREKVKKLFAPQAPTPAAPKGKSSPTLSNAQAAQASKTAAKLLSDEESKAEAAKLIRWND